jgi:hypothetical protein
MGDVELGAVVLARQDTGRRPLFGGDTMLGRRYYDPEGVSDRDEVPSDNPDAVLWVTDPKPGRASDFGSLPFEWVVTTDPSGANDETSIAFDSLPGSLPLLVDLGVDDISLGNNHSYGDLEPGIVSTIDSAGITHSRTDLEADDACASMGVDVLDETCACVSMSGSEAAG